MLILGVRTSPTEVRYALLDCNRQTAVFVNATEENRLKFPNGMTSPDEKLPWLHTEFERIFRLNSNIEKIAIKTSEYNRSETANARLATYMEGIVNQFSWTKEYTDSHQNIFCFGYEKSFCKGFCRIKSWTEKPNWME